MRLFLGTRTEPKFGDPYTPCPECYGPAFYNGNNGECWECAHAFLILNPDEFEAQREYTRDWSTFFAGVAIGLILAAVLGRRSA